MHQAPYFVTKLPIAVAIKALKNISQKPLCFGNKNGNKKVDEIDTWCQCYKTFYRRNLPSLNGNGVILCCIAILPCKLPWNGSKLLQFLTLEKEGLELLW